MRPSHRYNKSLTISFFNQSFYTLQRGSSLVLGIFILIVMSLLGAALIEIMESNEEAFTYEVLGTRAYNAAQSGIQWEMQQLFPLITATNDSGSDSSMCTANESEQISLDLSSVPGFNGCSAIVQCTSLVHELTTTYYTVISTGQCNINGEVTSRQIEMQARTIN
jgi:MSHA biogenesis protein MshP